MRVQRTVPHGPGRQRVLVGEQGRDLVGVRPNQALQGGARWDLKQDRGIALEASQRVGKLVERAAGKAHLDEHAFGSSSHAPEGGAPAGLERDARRRVAPPGEARDRGQRAGGGRPAQGGSSLLSRREFEGQAQGRRLASGGAPLGGGPARVARHTLVELPLSEVGILYDGAFGRGQAARARSVGFCEFHEQAGRGRPVEAQPRRCEDERVPFPCLGEQSEADRVGRSRVQRARLLGADMIGDRAGLFVGRQSDQIDLV